MEQINQPERQHRQEIIRGIIDQVMGETVYTQRLGALDDIVWDTVHELSEQNALPEDVSAYECFLEYLKVWSEDGGVS